MLFAFVVFQGLIIIIIIVVRFVLDLAHVSYLVDILFAVSVVMMMMVVMVSALIDLVITASDISARGPCHHRGLLLFVQQHVRQTFDFFAGRGLLAVHAIRDERQIAGIELLLVFFVQFVVNIFAICRR